MFTSHRIRDSISVPESPSVPKALGMMPRTTDWPACPCVLYLDFRTLSKVLKLFTFPEMWMKTGHAHLYRMSTDAFLISFLQQTLPAPPFLWSSLQKDVPTLCVICPLWRRDLPARESNSFISVEPPDIDSPSNAFPNMPLTKNTEILHNHGLRWAQVSIHLSPLYAGELS